MHISGLATEIDSEFEVIRRLNQVKEAIAEHQKMVDQATAYSAKPNVQQVEQSKQDLQVRLHCTWHMDAFLALRLRINGTWELKEQKN